MSEECSPANRDPLSGRLIIGASRQLNNLAMILITIMMSHITADMVCKYAFNAPIDGTLETVALFRTPAIERIFSDVVLDAPGNELAGIGCDNQFCERADWSRAFS